MSKDEKTTWLRMESSPQRNDQIAETIMLWRAINGGGEEPCSDSTALAMICREWADRERERIRRPSKDQD